VPGLGSSPDGKRSVRARTALCTQGLVRGCERLLFQGDRSGSAVLVLPSASPQGNDANGVMNEYVAWTALTSLSSAVKSSHISRTAKTTYRQS